MTISNSMAYISRKLVTQKWKQSETWLWLIQQLVSASFRSHTRTVTLSVHVWQNNFSPECLSKHWEVTGAQLQEGWVGRAWVAAQLLSLCGKCQWTCQPMHGDISAIPVLTHNLPGYKGQPKTTVPSLKPTEVGACSSLHVVGNTAATRWRQTWTAWLTKRQHKVRGS